MRLITFGLGAGATAAHLVLLGLVPGDGVTLSASPQWAYSVPPDGMAYSIPPDSLRFSVEPRE